MKIRARTGVNFWGILSVLFLAGSLFSTRGFAVTSSYADNFALPETQSGYAEEGYEVKCFQKLQRGAENVCMSFLEIFQGVKAERARRKADYLPVGAESFFIGILRGVGNGVKRLGVGFYEMITFPYAQGPILEELSDWAY